MIAETHQMWAKALNFTYPPPPPSVIHQQAARRRLANTACFSARPSATCFPQRHDRRRRLYPWRPSGITVIIIIIILRVRMLLEIDTEYKIPNHFFIYEDGRCFSFKAQCLKLVVKLAWKYLSADLFKQRPICLDTAQGYHDDHNFIHSHQLLLQLACCNMTQLGGFQHGVVISLM